VKRGKKVMPDQSQHDNPGGGPKLPASKTPAPDYATRPDVYRNPPEVHAVTLSPEDAAAVDAILDVPADGEETTADPMRIERAQEWLTALSTHRVEQPPMDLLQRTLDAVESDPMVKIGASVQMPAPTVRARSHAFSRRLVEYAAMAIAASVLLMVLIPGIGQARDTAKRVACADNLRIVGGAFEGYGKDNSGSLPSLASPVGGSWKAMDPAQATETEHSNTANLLPLLRKQYLAEPSRLACPALAATVPAGWTAAAGDVPDAYRGYSYVNMFAAQKPQWDHRTTTVVLADRNPIFTAEGCKSVHENSHNHAGKGSMVLYADASARWQTTPDVGPGGDNIWTVAGLPKQPELASAYSYREAPADLNDVFLAP
jgi:hypothetical protein